MHINEASLTPALCRKHWEPCETTGKTCRETQAGKKSQMWFEQGLCSRDGDRTRSPGSRFTLSSLKAAAVPAALRRQFSLLS